MVKAVVVTAAGSERRMSVAFTERFGVVIVLKVSAKQTHTSDKTPSSADVSAHLARSSFFRPSCIRRWILTLRIQRSTVIVYREYLSFCDIQFGC